MKILPAPVEGLNWQSLLPKDLDQTCDVQSAAQAIGSPNTEAFSTGLRCCKVCLLACLLADENLCPT